MQYMLALNYRDYRENCKGCFKGKYYTAPVAASYNRDREISKHKCLLSNEIIFLINLIFILFLHQDKPSESKGGLPNGRPPPALRLP